MADVSKIAGYNIKDATARSNQTRHTKSLSAGAANFNDYSLEYDGNSVIFTGEIKAVSSANTWVEIGTLPSGVLPSHAVYGSFTTAFGVSGIIKTGSSGKIQVWATSTFSNGFGYFTLGWLK